MSTLGHAYTVIYRPRGDPYLASWSRGLETFCDGSADGDGLLRTWHDRIDGRDRRRYLQTQELRRRGQSTRIEYRVRSAAGQVRWVSDTVERRGATGDEVVLDGLVVDITEARDTERALRETLGELERARADAEHRARTDGLTGLPNRGHLLDALARELARAERDASRVALLLLDLDHFKRINDAFGHPTGDEVLVGIGRCLQSVIRPYDVVARWGGEEFAILLPAVGGVGELRTVGERICRAIRAAPLTTAAGEVSVTASVGAALAIPGTTADDLLRVADDAMYAAKARGRDRVCIATAGDAERGAGPAEDALARALSLAAGVRERNPDLHVDQVADLAFRMAAELELTPVLRHRCRIVGLLHDVGNLALPDELLAADGRWSEVELEVMRRHTQIGAELVRHVAGLEEAASGVLHHHEAWDGSGYPAGLAGDAIPIEARVVAVADAYSAMTSTRRYRMARDPEGAIAELRRGAGRRHDPDAVEALARVIDAVGRERDASLDG